MTTIDERRKKNVAVRHGTTALEKKPKELKDQTIYMIVAVFALLAIGGVSYYLLAMEEEDEGEVYYNVRASGYFALEEEDALAIEPGGDAETLVIVENRGDTAKYKVSYDEKPVNWTVSLDDDNNFKIGSGITRIYVLSVSAAPDEKNGTYEIVVNITGKGGPGFFQKVSFFFKVMADDDDRKSRTGDNMEIQYTGMMSDGRVFDTSLEYVHKNSDIAKMDEYDQSRDRDDTTLPIENLGEASLIEGFQDGCFLRQVGETFVVEVPPEKGYYDSSYADNENYKHLYRKTLFFVITVVSLESS